MLGISVGSVQRVSPKRQFEQAPDWHQILSPYLLVLLSVHQFLAKHR